MRHAILTAMATVVLFGATASSAKAQGVVIVGGGGPVGFRANDHRHYHGCGHRGWERDHHGRGHNHGRGGYDDGRRYFQPARPVYPYPVAPRGYVVGGYYGWIPARPW